MRQLTRRGRARGFTLIELMVAITIAGILLVVAGPFFGDYVRNSRLRESGNTLFTEALMAQSDAIKLNTRVRLSTSGAVVQTFDVAASAVLRDRRMADGVILETQTIDFCGQGRPCAFGAAGSIDLSMTGQTCSSDTRCPGLRVDGGGAIRLCGDKLNTTSCPP